MKGFALTSPDQPAGLVDLPVPDLVEDGVRTRVRAASVNGFDVFQANGYLVAMMEHAFPTVIGRDFAGVVEAVGSARTDVVVGDEVLGFVTAMPPLHDGTYAEVVSGASGTVLARKPDRLSFETAAAIPLAGATALDAVDAIDIGPGDTVVVAGATGGVGSIAVPLAAQRGASVIATARPGDDDAFVRALGNARRVKFSRDGRLIVSAEGGTLVVSDAADGRVLGTLSGHRGSVSGCAVSPEGEAAPVKPDETPQHAYY